MELKTRYQYTYFIQNFIIKESKYSKYILRLLKDQRFKLKIFDKNKEIEMYTQFLPKIRNFMFRTFELEKSIHLTTLSPLKLDENKTIIADGDEVVEIVARVRQFKSENKLSLKTEIETVEIVAKNLDFIKACEQDLKAVCAIKNIKYRTGEFDVKIEKI